MKESFPYWKKALKKQSAVDLIKYISIEIWNRIGWTRLFMTRMGFMRLYEVTLTQNLVYELCKFSFENSHSIVSIYESKHEKVNGSDILVYKQFNHGFLIFPFQAKLLTTHKTGKNGTYKSFWHKNSNGLQIELLKNFAKYLGSEIGFFLLYNHTSGIKLHEKEEYYGCTYVSTCDLEKKVPKFKNIQFSTVHPQPAKPFYHFFYDDESTSKSKKPRSSSGKYNDVIDFFKDHGQEIDNDFVSNLKFYSLEEINKDIDEWVVISGKPNSFKEKVHFVTSNEFRPQFKILIATPFTSNSKKSKSAKIEGDLNTKEVEKEEEEFEMLALD